MIMVYNRNSLRQWLILRPRDALQRLRGNRSDAALVLRTTPTKSASRLRSSSSRPPEPPSSCSRGFAM